MSKLSRRVSRQIMVGDVLVGGGAPVVVQSMTNTDTADIAGTIAQVLALANAGSEVVRITVNSPEAAAAVAAIYLLTRNLFAAIAGGVLAIYLARLALGA